MKIKIGKVYLLAAGPATIDEYPTFGRYSLNVVEVAGFTDHDPKIVVNATIAGIDASARVTEQELVATPKYTRSLQILEYVEQGVRRQGELYKMVYGASGGSRMAFNSTLLSLLRPGEGNPRNLEYPRKGCLKRKKVDGIFEYELTNKGRETLVDYRQRLETLAQRVEQIRRILAASMP